MAASCTLNRLEEPSASGREGTQVTLTAIMADSDAGTKAMLVDGAPEVYWAPNDQIMVCKWDWGRTSFQSTNTEPAPVVDFTGSIYGSVGAINPINQIWAVYPCSWDNTYFDFNEGKYLELVVPFTQTPVAGTFDPKALYMVARSSSTELAFYHLGGGLKFKLTQDWIQQVEFRANDGTPLAGYVQVVIDDEGHPVVSEYEETTDAVLLTAPRGQTFQKDTWYYLCCLPAVLEQGYTLTFRSENKTGVAVHSGPAEVKRATWGVLETADAGVVPEDADNDLFGDTIYYTTTDGKIIEPRNTWGFGANLISNVYENGQGIMTFDGPVTGFSDSVFSSAQTLESMRVPSTVWAIGSYAFNYCTSLKSIQLPDKLNFIENRAFQSAQSLTEIYIPGSVRDVGEGAFYGCSSLTSFSGPLATSDGRGLVIDGKLLAFAPGGLSYPFDYVVDEGVTHLGDKLFSYANYLRTVTLPESLETFGEQVFSSTSGLMSFLGKFASEDGHLLVKDGEIIATALNGVEEFTVPGTVKSIAPYAFTYKQSLRTLTLDEGVETVGDYAFAYCYNLQNVTLPESLTTLGQQIFRSDGNIQQFHGKYATADGHFLVVDGVAKAVVASEMGHCVIPDVVTVIDDHLFSNSALVSITIPEGVTEIGAEAFSYCYNLHEVTLPQSLRRIGRYAFIGCQNEAFNSLTIPSGVANVGGEIVYNCTHLTSVTVLPSIPPTVEEGWSPLTWDSSVGFPIYVPEESMVGYQNADGWRYQSNYQPVSLVNQPSSSENVGEDPWN